MIKEGIEKLQELARKADKSFIGADGKEYSFEKLHRVYDDPRPSSLTVMSLTGLVDYLENNVDELEKEKLMINVVAHDRVVLITNVHGEKNDIHAILSVKLDGDVFPFERYLEQENFIIKVNAMFQDTEDKAMIMAHTAKVQTDQAMNTHHDGITQQVQIKQGVRGALTETTDLKPIVKMKPFRTFRELDQPESEFLFRMRDNGGAEAALFEADGGTWKNDARKKIAEFLSETGVAIIA